MRVLFVVGAIVLILGIASLFVALPQRERAGVQVGDANIGVTTTTHEKVSPVISAVLIIGGAGMMIAGRGRRSA
jgi:hypothetical protein